MCKNSNNLKNLNNTCCFNIVFKNFMLHYIFLDSSMLFYTLLHSSILFNVFLNSFLLFYLLLYSFMLFYIFLYRFVKTIYLIYISMIINTMLRCVRVTEWGIWTHRQNRDADKIVCRQNMTPTK